MYIYNKNWKLYIQYLNITRLRGEKIIAKILKIIILFIIIINNITLVKAQENKFNCKTPDLRIVVDKELIKDENMSQIIEDNIYIPLRKYMEMFGAKVIWLKDKEIVLLNNGNIYRPEVIIKDNFAMISPYYLNNVFGYKIEYFKNYNILYISTNCKDITEEKLCNILPIYKNYSKEDLIWLSKIIHAESRGESYESKIAVGNVILNRKASNMYPETIKEVIFDNKNGVQFTPTVNGSINKKPSFLSFIAALEVLEGKKNAEEVLFFMNSKIAKTTWISKYRKYAFSIENHDFFY